MVRSIFGTLKLIFSKPPIRTGSLPATDPLSHPELERMSLNQLADLPFERRR